MWILIVPVAMRSGGLEVRLAGAFGCGLRWGHPDAAWPRARGARGRYLRSCHARCCEGSEEGGRNLFYSASAISATGCQYWYLFTSNPVGTDSNGSLTPYSGDSAAECLGGVCQSPFRHDKHHLLAPALADPIHLGTCRRQVLRRVVLSSDAMTRLTLSSCPSLQELVLDCPFLRDVEFNACGMLTDSTLQTLSTTWLGQAPAAFPAGNPPGCCSHLRCACLQLIRIIFHQDCSQERLMSLHFVSRLQHRKGVTLER